ncbi:rCG26050 [Rattus norvegicus]|uniref:RCG26050 n=1 Tax=Rattus norvegicus TaxID=10116 RepID=A6I1F1_RAT|nr:rCG26050 [Rattus norvegicus]
MHRHTYSHTHSHIHTHAHMHTCTDTHIHTHTFTHTHTYTHTCTHSHTHIHTCTDIHIHTHSHIHTHMHTCTDTHIHTHTHTHTHSLSLSLSLFYTTPELSLSYLFMLGGRFPKSLCKIGFFTELLLKKHGEMAFSCFKMMVLSKPFGDFFSFSLMSTLSPRIQSLIAHQLVTSIIKDSKRLCWRDESQHILCMK